MSDPVTEARDALLAKLTSDWDFDPYGEHEAAVMRLRDDLVNLIALARASAAVAEAWLARAEAGVSVEVGRAWADVEAGLPEHHYFKVEHDSDDDPSWYLAVWRSDGIYPDPIRWAHADTLLDGLTRLALELRTPR